MADEKEVLDEKRRRILEQLRERRREIETSTGRPISGEKVEELASDIADPGTNINSLAKLKLKKFKRALKKFIKKRNKRAEDFKLPSRAVAPSSQGVSNEGEYATEVSQRDKGPWARTGL